MPKRSFQSPPPVVDMDMQDTYEAAKWHAVWRKEFGEESDDGEYDCDAMDTVPEEEYDVDAQIEHAVHSAAINLANHYKCLLDDPQESTRAQALDPRTLLRLLTAERTRNRAIDETISTLKSSTLAQERWSDASYWGTQAKLELSFTLEVNNGAAERPNVLLRTLPVRTRIYKSGLRRNVANAFMLASSESEDGSMAKCSRSSL
ncbi:uncharacterized protein B0H18DRAFT_1022110 [Fomitopsis serialis]|uniref:uncharacterized protein n=1 Tax=Fomitopsis serialis TaxID=139415 RepID=UPI002008B9D8|nr:uncharacterized protein B0H18DRAFT_1022110 [Neoantrodia serialis]KAH9921138.1 hypothetical protein B0H18DRAFT_1022110 [Neoantrodia serialis]